MNADTTPTPKWWQRKTWQLVMVGTAAAVIGFIAGIAGSASERESLQNRLDAANKEITDYAAKHDALVASGERALERVKADARANRIRANELDARAAKIKAAETTIKQNTIEDGIWQIGVDFDPGTYRSTAQDCYWEILSSPDGSFNSLQSNGLGANQTVTLSEGWFSSEDCGPWQKVG